MVLKVTVVKTLGDIRGLLLDGDEDVAGLVVETLLRRVVTDVLDGLSDDGLVVDESLGSDLSEDHDHSGKRTRIFEEAERRLRWISDEKTAFAVQGRLPGLGSSLASNLGPRVLGKAGVELSSDHAIDAARKGGKKERWVEREVKRKKRTRCEHPSVFTMSQAGRARRNQLTIASETASQILSIVKRWGEERRKSESGSSDPREGGEGESVGQVSKLACRRG